MNDLTSGGGGTWRRWHKYPKICRNCLMANMTCKQHYYLRHSFRRYLRTPDGMYFSRVSKLRVREIGRVDSVRFVVSPM
jgi:hypothetical protein